MKIAFSKSVEYTPEFHKNKELPITEQLIATCGVIEINEYFHILDVLQNVGFKEGDQNSLTLAQMALLSKEAGAYLLKYVKLTGNDGFSLEDVVKYPKFFPLTTELLFKLVEIASPSDQDVKN